MYKRQGIYIIGDASFYVGYDSVDVWAERQLFMMSANDTPEYVAAAAPDKYSENGQVWGNPMSVSYTHLDVYKRQHLL